MVGRIGRRAEFEHLRAHGVTLREGRLRVRCAVPPAGSDSAVPAFAWSIGRGQGSAVRRNRVRRRLREVVRIAEREGRLSPRWYLVTVVPTSREPGFEELRGWMDAVLTRVSELPDQGAPAPGAG